MRTFFFVAVSLSAVVSCSAQKNSYKFYNKNKLELATFESINDSSIVFKNTIEKAKVLKYINAFFAGTDMDVIDEVYLDLKSDVVKYLILKGKTKTNTNLTVALPIKLRPENIGSKDMIYAYVIEPDPGESGHTCAGVGCSCCRFLKNSQGQIAGCECYQTERCTYQTNGYCNHTISTGTQ
jgi:hypothetical protein